MSASLNVRFADIVAKVTGDSGSAFEALLIGDFRLFRSSARN
jgi:hypothetical protein